MLTNSGIVVEYLVAAYDFRWRRNVLYSATAPRSIPTRVILSLALVLAVLTALFVPQTAQAACPTTLSLSLLNDPYLLIDSNNPASGPQVTVAYATITNTGAATAYDVYMYIGNGITPGTFAAGSDGQRLSMLGSVADATRFIVNLAPGESRTVYWMLKYPLTNGQTYPMTIWASNAAGCFVQGSHTYTTQSTVSASANRMLGTVTLNPPDGQVHVGNILTVTVTGFNFGIIGSNGDAWLQPVGNLDFNPDQFRLIGTETYIHSIAGRCGYGSMPVYNRLYFPGIRTCYSYNAADYIKYYFVATAEGTTTAKVYQQAASGALEKYSIDYGKPGATVTLTAHCGGVLLWKSVNPQTATADTLLTWTITYRNDTDLPVGDPGSGNGLTVRDEAIPANTSYIAGSATCSGNCIIYYSTDNGVTWTTTEPVPASSVNKLKWFINQVIPAHSTGTVSFQSRVNTGVPGYPLICNQASAGIADCPFSPVDIICVNGGADLDILKQVNDHSPCEGGDITYTITVSNPSTTNATGVQVTDLLPSGLTYLNHSTSQGTYNNTTGLWNVGSLNASSNATLTLIARVNAGTAGTTIINWGNITYADQIDPVIINNADHDGITVHDTPASYPSSNSPVCEGTTIYLFGDPGGMTSYQWTGPNGFSSSDQNPTIPNATLAMSGLYTLTIVDSSGCGNASSSINVVVQSCAGVALDPAAKTDSLLIDADGNGQVSAGDTMLYTVTVWNEGTADATGVIFSDTPDPNTTLVIGSVAASKGAIVRGNTPGDTWVEVNIGTILAGGPASETVTISFHVTINDPLPSGVTHIYNQGVFTSNEAPPVVTNDPDTFPDDDSTGTPVFTIGRSEFNGIMSWSSYLLSFTNRILGYIFDSSTGGLKWSPDSSGQIVLSEGTLPSLTEKGSDIVGALMTIVHNSLVFLAQIATMLPSNALAP